eukprot:TRINITY_DN2467_c0_g3_i3.p1 TRINITY_DN2467_c0_g3~~TRINITY_DN2467_c0_g3_i3.p1  ORF type:complete len:495 (+),score=173.24 TRINITY_DN2467_c0_g3_i3:27-1511(+)
MSSMKPEPTKEKEKTDGEAKAAPAEAQKKRATTYLQDLVQDVLNWDRATSQRDSKQCYRLARNLRRSKNGMKAHYLSRAFVAILGREPLEFSTFNDFDASFSEKLDLPAGITSRLQKNQEVELYLGTMLSIYLVKKRSLAIAAQHLDNALRLIKELNRRHLDMLRAIIYFYYSRVAELNGSLKAIRQELLEGYRTSVVNKDEIGQAILLNLLLRNFLAFNEVEAASNLIDRTKFPENKFNNEQIRFLYYKSRVRAIQQEYQEAFALVQQAIRKSPDKVGRGFRVQAQKLATVVELLLGDLPARAVFSAEEMRGPLTPYFLLVKAVAIGNLEEFYKVVKSQEQVFGRDRLLNLINRLHQNVVRTGLRRINLSYSRISLQDIAEKLRLPGHRDAGSVADIEFIVAKAIRDGTMNAYIDHKAGTVVMRELQNVYLTQEPTLTCQKRIGYCLNLYTAALKAHQYPEAKVKLPSLDDRESDLDEEDLMKMIEDFDDYDF